MFTYMSENEALKRIKASSRVTNSVSKNHSQERKEWHK